MKSRIVLQARGSLIHNTQAWHSHSGKCTFKSSLKSSQTCFYFYNSSTATQNHNLKVSKSLLSKLLKRTDPISERSASEKMHRFKTPFDVPQAKPRQYWLCCGGGYLRVTLSISPSSSQAISLSILVVLILLIV
jgi:hypothetical protein